MNRYFVRQTSGKRLLAGFLDTIFVALLAIFLYVPAQTIAEAAGGSQNTFLIGSTMIYSGLFEFSSENNSIHVIDEAEKFPQALYTFYVDKANPDYEENPTTEDPFQQGFAPRLNENSEYNTAEDYYVAILGKGDSQTLFDFSVIDPEKPWEVPVISGKEVDAKLFYAAQIDIAHNQLNQHPAVYQMLRKYERYTILTIGASYLISAIILTLLLPLVLKDYTTLGKLISGSIVTSSSGFKITKLQSFFRNLAIFIFSYTFFFMPFHIVSFLLGKFSSNNKSLYDRLTDTLVADKKKSIIFANVTDEQIYRKELAQRLIAVDRRKAEARNRETSQT